jgi:FMN phosphatase YigB (HAD superfamily)
VISSVVRLNIRRDAEAYVHNSCDGPRRFVHMFFDAEGTLYVPRGRASASEFWSAPSADHAREFFRLDDGVREALETLRRTADTMCIVSWNKKPILDALLEENAIGHIFDDIMLNGDKGRLIRSFLSRRGVRPDMALMIGDTPELDIHPVRRVGVEAILVDRPYNRGADAERIRGVCELPAWLERTREAGRGRLPPAMNATLDQFLDAEEARRTKRLISVTDSST